jgi:transcriptional regulator
LYIPEFNEENDTSVLHSFIKAVPTWNYAVVHACGNPEIKEDRTWLLEHINELTNIHESAEEMPWKVSDAPDEFIEIPIKRLKGKFKLGQNRSDSDKLGIVEGLNSKHNGRAEGLATLLNRHIQQSE